MLVPDRQRTILRLLSDRGRLTLAEIRTRLSISAATARRDAGQLSAAGLARRTHGGLLPADFVLSELVPFIKEEQAIGTKVRLGRAAAALLPEDGTVFVDAGTTCLEVGRALLDRPNLRIFTDSVSLLACAAEARATVAAIGGEVRRTSLAITGALAHGWLEQLRFDAAVMGASAMDPRSGVFAHDASEASVKIDALRRARLRILVAHSGKWGEAAGVKYADWSAFHHLVTDRAPPRDERFALGSAHVKVHIVAAK